MARLYEGIFKGFNLIFGNILDQNFKGRRRSGNLRLLTNKNDGNNSQSPLIVTPGTAHGLSNGGINIWSKVHAGRKQFFDCFIEAEKMVKTIKDENELKAFMSSYAKDIHLIM